GRTVASLQASSAISIAITGHQWWWEVQYEDAVPSRGVLTANEIHIPVNRPVVFKVTSRDVIHSFWVPNLQGKRDLIPGYTTALWLQASRAVSSPGHRARRRYSPPATDHRPPALAVAFRPTRRMARDCSSTGHRAPRTRGRLRH